MRQPAYPDSPRLGCLIFLCGSAVPCAVAVLYERRFVEKQRPTVIDRR